MPDESAFQDLLRRVRDGDEAAAADLVRQYEPTIRRVVRVRLVDTRLRRLLDSMDICQSVLVSFFVRLNLGQFELSTPEDHLKLLATMTRNKLIDQARKLRPGRHDERPLADDSSAPQELVAPDPSPSQQLIARDLVQEIRRRLTPAERQLLELRDQGCDWEQIATQLGGSAEALRKQLARAIDRVAKHLGVENLADE